MTQTSTNSLLENFIKIKNAARETYDGHRCMIAPSPELKEKINEEVSRLKTQLGDSVIANKIKVGTEYKPVGLNDGLIYPGTMFPVGTSASLARSAAANKAPLTGTLRVIVVLVDFADKEMTTTKAHFEDLFFSLGVISTGSVREYYREVTHGNIDIQGQVVGTYRMPKTLAEYAHGASGMGNSFPNARSLAKDAAVASNEAVNYALYDNDNDSFVDAFIIIHAGTGGEVSGNGSDIWSHKWVLEGGAFTADGTTKIYGYLTVPEDCRLGVCAHELGHLLFGFPDLYDTDDTSEGIGNWCLMSGGSWNNGGLTPAHPSAWCKCQQNWVTTENHTFNQSNVAIEDVKSGFKVHRLWKDGAAGSEYFLVENRQKTSYDRFLPESGLLVWHIDEATDSNTNEAHYKVALMQADGKKDMELNHNRGDAGDCFPGSSANRNFDNTSNPSSKSYAGSNTCVSITGISDPATVMRADINVKCRLKFKEVIKEVTKETKEFDKSPDKSMIADKSNSGDKIFVEKTGDAKFGDTKLGEFGRGGLGGWMGSGFTAFGSQIPAGTGTNIPGTQPNISLEARVANLEALLGQIQPYIQQSLRPDLSQSALSEEEKPEAEM